MDYFLWHILVSLCIDDPPYRLWEQKKHKNTKTKAEKNAIIVPVVIFCTFSFHIHKNADNTFAYVYRGDH